MLRRAVLVALLVTSSASADSAWTPRYTLPATGQIDGWYGPFASSADGEATPRSSRYAVDDEITWDGEGDAHPTYGEALWDDGDGDPAVEEYGAAGDAWGIAIETSAGWFVSPRLGTRANRDNCDVKTVKSIGDRVAIEYTCYQGRFDTADRDFFLYCGLDDKQRFACARYLTTANLSTESAPKEDTSVTTTTYARSCKPSVKNGTVSFRYAKPPREPGERVKVRSRKCPAAATPTLSAPPGIGGAVPTFTAYGHEWVPPAYR